MLDQVFVIDGEALEMRRTRLRLHGVEAPGSGQFCSDNLDETYRCGQTATLGMESFVRGNIVTCTIKDKDRYGRLVIECFVDGKNINKKLVHHGFALACREPLRLY